MNYLGLEDKDIKSTVSMLNELLASYHIYYQNLRNFHWNIQGLNFFDLHEKYENLYNDARTSIDEIAERILTLRHRPLSNYSTYLEYSKVMEAGDVFESREMIEKTLYDHKLIIEQMRNIIETASQVKDEGTVDLISSFLGNLEKQSWMLDSWLVRQQQLATS